MTDSILVPSANVKNKLGHKWGRWEVIAFAGYNKGRQSLWRCRCLCGTERIFSSGYITAVHRESCGCYNHELTAKRNKTHGSAGSPEYIVWCGMKERCTNPRQAAYRNYGGRGITVCERWLGPNGFAHFLADRGTRPTTKHTSDRIDNDKGYGPENCRWATRGEQSRNRRGLQPVTYKGESMCVVDWAKRLGIKPDTLFMRLHRGWSVERAFETPVRDCRFGSPLRLTRGTPA